MAAKRLTRQESKTVTRRDLLRAAGRLFLRKGFVATSLADIADEVGVTKGAVYSNFASKEELSSRSSASRSARASCTPRPTWAQ
jgi:AcrR family transcriptional regulator